MQKKQLELAMALLKQEDERRNVHWGTKKGTEKKPSGAHALEN